MTTFRITTPDDYVLARDVCSYGYFLLEPNHWDPVGLVFTTTMLLGAKGRAVTLRMGQSAGASGSKKRERAHTYSSLKVHAGRPKPGEEGGSGFAPSRHGLTWSP